jgi:hypothetical protein
MTETETEPELWTAPQCAAEWDVQPKTWHSYVANGLAPKPDRADYVGRTPRWRADVVRAAKKARPGQGKRSDLARLDLTLQLDATMYSLPMEIDEAADESLPMDQRVTAAGDASASLLGISRAMTELMEYCERRAAEIADSIPQDYDPQDPPPAVLRDDALRTVLNDLANDFDQIGAKAAARAGSVEACTAPSL